MNNQSIAFVSSSLEYDMFKLLSKQKGLSNARLFSHMLHKFPCGKHIIEFDELPIYVSKPVRFSLFLNIDDIKKLGDLCKLYGVKRPLIFKILLFWYNKEYHKKPSLLEGDSIDFNL